jgi:hypothetical protein
VQVGPAFLFGETAGQPGTCQIHQILNIHDKYSHHAILSRSHNIATIGMEINAYQWK